MRSYEDWRELLAGERLPAAIVDLDAFDRNARKLVEIVRSKRKPLRLATKSIRVPELIKRVLSKDPLFQGLMVFSAEEAALLAEQGFSNLLLAYPTVQVSDLQILRKLHDQGRTSIKAVVDSREALEAFAEAMKGVSEPFSLVLDVDMSLRLLWGRVHLGVRRSPIRSSSQLRALLRNARSFGSVRIVGAMGYEAQVAGLPDRNPFKKIFNPVFRWVRSVSMKRVARLRAEVAQAFRNEGVRLEVFNGGGSGSLNWAVNEDALTEVTAGSALLDPHLFDYYSNIRFEPACFFALQAVRSSDPGFVTCQGGGYVASGEAGKDRLPIVACPQGSTLVSAEGAGEVQTPVRLEGGEVSLGEPVLFRHAKAGELAERFNEYLLVSGGKIVGRTKTYRGLGWCFH